MLAKLGCSYVVVGHSERREHHGEDDALVAAKAAKAVDAGITPIVCVGERLAVREADGHVDHCMQQIEGSLAGLTPDQVAEAVIAYEPVWAIGTGQVATPEDAQEVCSAIREQVAKTWSSQAAEQVRILYGGSVKAANAAAIMAQPDVDGALVGGASLQAEEFAAICRFNDLPDLSGVA
jgi:triosephosphate isomerase